MKKGSFFQWGGAILIAAVLFVPNRMLAQQPKGLSIVTGGTGGVYYIMGGGIANMLTKNLSNFKVTAESTAASVDNAKLIDARKADLAFIAGDVAYDACMGAGKFKNKVPLRNLLVPYSDFIQFVAVEGAGINSVKDLRGRKVSIGAPGSGTEVKGLRILEAVGIDPEKEIKRDRLSVAESAGAMKDRKIEAFNWAGGLPTAAIMDLAATPGIRIKLLDLGDLLPKLREKYGPVYFGGVIPKGTYLGMQNDVHTLCVANVFCCHEKLDEELAYQITRLIIEKKDDLVLVHKEAAHITLKDAAAGSPIPYHPGAIRYFKEKGITTKQ